MNITPYFSLDIETTGLDKSRSRVLEIALVYDDGVTPIEQLKGFRSCVKQEDSQSAFYYEPAAMSMHSDLLKEIAKQGESVKDKYTICNRIQSFIEDNSSVGAACITLAGKNIAGFDLPILNSNMFYLPNIHHRTIDVGSLYYSKFGYVPSLSEINELIGYKPVAHRALDDALNVVVAIRHLMEIK